MGRTSSTVQSAPELGCAPDVSDWPIIQPDPARQRSRDPALARSRPPSPAGQPSGWVDRALSELNIGKTKLYELRASGDAEAIRIGRRTLILQASIDALVERLRSSPLTPR